MTLKAIGNAGRPESAEDILLNCALNQDAPVNMTIASIEALRRLPCDNSITDELMNIYRDPVFISVCLSDGPKYEF